MKKNPTGWINAAIILIIIGFGVALAKGYRDINYVNYLSLPDTTTLYKPILEVGKNDKKSLQLKSFAVSTPIPTSTPITPGQTVIPTTIVNTPPPQPPPSDDNVCPGGTPQTNTCTCKKNTDEVLWCNSPSTACSCPYTSGPEMEQCPTSRTGYCYFRKEKEGYTKYANNPECFYSCLDKPVLYFYPLSPLYVDVKLDIPGHVTVSDPLYDPLSGWKNVLAYPNGQLFYNQLYYPYLYYETAVSKKIIPKNGEIISINSLEITLKKYLYDFGLNQVESRDFLEYWIPRLEEEKSPYIFFSLYNDKQKDEVDRVEINPKPDTFIHFLAYFEPIFIQEPVLPSPLKKPSQRPERKGFTVVEWGGTIE